MKRVWRRNLAASRRSFASLAALGFLLGSGLLFGADAIPKASADKRTSRDAARRRIAVNYGNLPLAFEENRGQTDPRVKYFSRGNDYRLFLTAGKAVLSLDKPRQAHAAGLAPGFVDGSGELGVSRSTMQPPSVLTMEVVGANPSAAVAAGGELPGKSNYFIGNDQSRWRTDVSRYERVRYQEVYPGIDLVYHGQHGRLEYDFVVSPGADPTPIRLRFEGSDTVAMEADGGLRLDADGASIRQRKPFVYQKNGDGRVEIAGHFVKLSGNEFGFEVGPYDRSRELVIDPEIIYSTYLGGTSFDLGRAIAIDSQRNAYIVGTTSSLQFPGSSNSPGSTLQPEKGIPSTMRRGDADAYLVKLNASGSQVIYSTFLGGDDTGQFIDTGDAVQVDAAGNAYFLGLGTLGFPITAGSLSATAGFNQDSYVLAKINPAGNTLLFSTRIVQNTGGIFAPNIVAGFVFDIAIDPQGNTYFTGGRLHIDGTQIWAGRINSTGTALTNGVVIGPGGVSSGFGISRDAGGNVYVTGGTNQPLPTTPGAFESIRSGGMSDAFVAKLDSSFLPVFVTYLSSDFDEQGRSIATNAAGNVYVTGFTGSTGQSTLDPSDDGEAKGFKPFPTTPSGFDRECCGQDISDAFLAVLNPAGSQLLYGTHIGGNNFSDDFDVGNDIAVDASGRAHIIGTAATTDFPVTADAFQSQYAGGETDGFYAIIDPSLAGINALVFSSFLGGEGRDEGWGLALDPAINAYVTGSTASREFPTTLGTFQPVSVDPSTGAFIDAFVAKIGEPCLVLAAAPTNINFGVVPPFVRSAAMPVRLTLSEPVTEFGALLSDQLNFEVSGTPRVISQREVEFDVFFVPRENKLFNATIELFATAEQGRAECHQIIMLQGQTLSLGAEPRSINFSPEEVDCGEPAGPRRFVVTNNTNSRLVVDVNWRDRQALRVTPSGMVTIGAIGSNDNTRAFDVTYLLPSDQPFSDVITFTVDGTLILEVGVTAPACGALLSVDPLVLSFGHLPLNGSVTLPVTVTTARPTNLPVTITVPEGQPFMVSQPSFNVSAAAPAVIDVTFQPVTAGFFDTTIAFNAEGGAVEVAVSGSSSFGTIEITGVEVSVDPAPDPLPTVGVQFDGAPEESLRGRLEFAFVPDNPNLPPDPLQAFLDTGTTSIDFRLPTGSTQAQFLVTGNPTAAAFQPGTLAGTITFRLSQLTTEDGGRPVDFTGATVASTRVEPGPPIISSTTCSRSGTTLTIVARGLSTTREITGVNLNLTAATGANLTFTPPNANFANSAISAWYASEASIASGSTIAVTVPLQVQGAFNALGTATISFSNSEGQSNTGQVNVSACQ